MVRWARLVGGVSFSRGWLGFQAWVVRGCGAGTWSKNGRLGGKRPWVKGIRAISPWGNDRYWSAQVPAHEGRREPSKRTEPVVSSNDRAPSDKTAAAVELNDSSRRIQRPASSHRTSVVRRVGRPPSSKSTRVSSNPTAAVVLSDDRRRRSRHLRSSGSTIRSVQRNGGRRPIQRPRPSTSTALRSDRTAATVRLNGAPRGIQRPIPRRGKGQLPLGVPCEGRTAVRSPYLVNRQNPKSPRDFSIE